MLIALGRGDKYRLMHVRETLESGKDLYISDKNFLHDLVKTHLKDRIYHAKIVSTPDAAKLFCEECGSEISSDEKFCTSCGTSIESSSPSTIDVHAPTPEPKTELVVSPKPKKKSKQQELEEYESEYLNRSEKPQESEGFTFTDDGEIDESSTRKVIQEKPTIKLKPAPKPKPKKKSKQQELEEYESKYLTRAETKVSWKAYDVKAKRKVEIQNPKAIKMKNGKWAIKGTSPITGIKVFRIVGMKKPDILAEKTTENQKVEEPTTPPEKIKASTKAKKEVFSRYYKHPEVSSPKPKKSKSKKPNLFCEECGSKIAANDTFCTNCGTKR